MQPDYTKPIIRIYAWSMLAAALPMSIIGMIAAAMLLDLNASHFPIFNEDSPRSLWSFAIYVVVLFVSVGMALIGGLVMGVSFVVGNNVRDHLKWLRRGLLAQCVLLYGVIMILCGIVYILYGMLL